MARYVVDMDDPQVIEATGIRDAVKQYIDAHADAGWSDHFDVCARAESDDQWTVFPVATRTELVVTVGNGKPGPMAESDDSEAAR